MTGADWRDGQWHPTSPASFVARISTWNTKAGRVIIVPRRGHAARVVRLNPQGKTEYERCGHVHAKVSAAKACAVAFANRLNRLAKQTAEQAR